MKKIEFNLRGLPTLDNPIELKLDKLNKKLSINVHNIYNILGLTTDCAKLIGDSIKYSNKKFVNDIKEVISIKEFTIGKYVFIRPLLEDVKFSNLITLKVSNKKGLKGLEDLYKFIISKYKNAVYTEVNITK